MSAQTNATNQHIEETSVVENANTIEDTSIDETSSISSQQSDMHNSVKSSTSKSSLIVNYLPQTMSQEEMQSLFSTVGEIESCKLIRDKVTRQSLAYGFVNYVKPEDAEKAIKMFNGLRLQNKTIKVSSVSAEQNGGTSTKDPRVNLIVNYLPQAMTQEEMHSLFSTIGEVESCKLIRDKITGQSLAYGFVNYVKPEDAEKSIKMFNGLRLQNKTLKVSQVSVEQKSSGSTKYSKMNLIVNYLPQTMTEEEIHSLFSSVGEIESCKLMRDKVTGQSLAYCFVNYVKPEDAEKAINTLNGHRLENKAIKVAYATPSSEAIKGTSLYSPEGASKPLATQFGNNPNTIPPLADPYFSPKQRFPGPIHHPGYRFSRYSPLAGNILAHHPLLSKNSMKGSGWCIFVYNLAPDTEDSLLWQLFGPFGAVQSVKVIRDLETSTCKGFGFVNMTNYDEAELAVRSLNGFTLGTRVLQVSFKTN